MLSNRYMQNKFYDRAYQMYNAAIIIRCYTQHAFRPDIDFEIKFY